MKKLQRLLLFLVGLSFSLFLAGSTVGQSSALVEAGAAATQRGFQYLDRGEATAALEQWQIAEQSYRSRQFPEGIVGSQVNQSLALQQLGLYPRACRTLVSALALDAQLCQAGEDLSGDNSWAEKLRSESLTKAHLSGLNSLGIVLTSLGKPETALQLLRVTNSLPNTSPALRAQLFLNIGNAESEIALARRGQYDGTTSAAQQVKFLNELQQAVDRALAGYEQAGVGEERSRVLAEVNALQLLVEAHEWTQGSSPDPGKTNFERKVVAELPQRLQCAQGLELTALPAIEAVYAQLSLSRSFQRQGNLLIAKNWATQALQSSEKLGNLRAQSFAWGILARQAKTQDAVPLYQKALALSRAVQASDISYYWEQSLGRWAFQQGNLKQAEEYYRSAVEDLDQVRGNLLAVNASAQFSLEDQVEPTYREYLQILFSSPTPDLEQAITTSQKLQRAQLENYLRCGRLDLVALNQVHSSTSETTRIYVIDGAQQIEVIVQPPNQSLHHYSVAREPVRSAVKSLQLYLQDADFETIPQSGFLPPSQRLYDLLIAPARKGGYLPNAGTLVFALDYELQAIPMGMLYDGKNYLIQSYSMATTLGTQLRRPFALNRFESLVAGVSQPAPSFTAKNVLPNLQALPEVEQEVRSITATTPAKVLLNERFTVTALQRQIQQTDYPIVHLTTHGQFSSDPSATLLLAWDRPITVGQLNQLVSERIDRQSSIELLVLSACQTAKGDRRSALGLAGIAAQAGARSTIASLWVVDDKSTAQLVSHFYRELKAGKTKAEALRQAELTLLNQPETSHPYYWAPFLLVGSWL